MASPLDPRINDNPSTYFVQDRKNKKELTRLMIQDQMITAAMGGILPEQADPSIFRSCARCRMWYRRLEHRSGPDLINDVTCGHRHQPTYD